MRIGRKLFSTLILGLLLVSGWLCPAAHAQSGGRKTVVKVNPLSIFVGTANVKVERTVGERFSVQLGAYVGAPILQFDEGGIKEKVRYFYIGVVPELRYYIAFNRVPIPKGFFVAASTRYAFVREHYAAHANTPQGIVHGGVWERNQVYTIGFLLGYQLIFKNHLTLESYIGPQYSFLHTRRTFSCPTCNGDERPFDRPGLRFDGIDPRFGITVGYQF